jgi:hypothetical protein
MDGFYVGNAASKKSGIITAGNTNSFKNCVDWAIDGFNVAGIPFVYKFEHDTWTIAAAPTPAAAD